MVTPTLGLKAFTHDGRGHNWLRKSQVQAGDINFSGVNTLSSTMV